SSLFFFSSRRRHTRFSRDWSSDVCSSDLRNKTVWGLKKSPRGYVVELYFYNHGDQDRNLRPSQLWAELPEGWSSGITPRDDLPRSEERRVGKECRSRWSPWR